MNKSWRHQRKLRKQRLLNEIQQQRQSLSIYSQHWLEITQPYDKGWQTLLAFKPYVAIGSGIALFYGLCYPKKFYRWSRHMISILGIMKIVRNTLYKG
ncbi:YqjK-like family protein [Xenorhabdus lircayensis]|uniref:YqjK-like family protein n=1 Tax=Xenorhabdus lircayensis TaxID=2763499 RepID=A0ABS0U8D9_9GAMM|nr:YqjK-like family protein [Xenorhabdus lircayensis]MBI6549233.1 YqjK-like family protein [Xenorhabdus lircayensis]